MSPAPVETSASYVKTSAEARSAARGKSSRSSSMIKAAECAGMGASLSMRRQRSMRLRSPAKTATPALASAIKSASATKPARMIESRSPAIEVVAIDEDSAVRYVGVVVVDDVSVMPVKSPVVPSPTKPAKKQRLEAQAKNYAWTR